MGHTRRLLQQWIQAIRIPLRTFPPLLHSPFPPVRVQGMALGPLRLAFQRANVHLADEDAVLRNVKAISEGGPSKLLVITDFDMTLTRYYVNGKRGYTSYSVIENSPLMPLTYREETLELRKKYAPVEISHDISLQARTEAMVQWFGEAHRLLVEHRLSKDMITEMVRSANVALRSGCERLFSTLDTVHVPLLIFSAGLTDTIMEILAQHSSFHDNMRIISNKIHFDDSGKACGFSEPKLHSYNKGQTHQQFSSVSEEVKGRRNVILIGDSLGDPKMIGGLRSVDHVIKIGFLNCKEEELLPTYLQLYDIVLTGESNMDVVNAVTAAVLNITENGI